jgi:hypothetical protein
MTASNPAGAGAAGHGLPGAVRPPPACLSLPRESSGSLP